MSSVNILSSCNKSLGQVSKNANIDSAVHPEWRTAKTHVVTLLTRPDEIS